MSYTEQQDVVGEAGPSLIIAPLETQRARAFVQSQLKEEKITRLKCFSRILCRRRIRDHSLSHWNHLCCRVHVSATCSSVNQCTYGRIDGKSFSPTSNSRCISVA